MSTTISRARAEQAQRRRFESIAGASFLAGASQFLLINTISESLYPGYDVRNQALSELGVGQVATLWNASLFLLGVAVVIGGYFVYRSLGSRLSTTLALMLGIGSIGAAIFQLDSPTDLHGFFALLAFAGGGLFALTSFRAVASRWMKLYSIMLGAFSISALILHVSGFNLGLGGGGMERMIVFPLIIWLAAFSGYTLRATTAEKLGLVQQAS